MRLKEFLVLATVFFIALFLVSKSEKISSIFSFQKPINYSLLSGDFDFTASRAFFNNELISPPVYQPEFQAKKIVLGESNLPKRIEIDLTSQRLYAYEGDQKVYDFLISSGKWGKTPVGNFKIWVKLRYTLMTGGSKALHTYYYLPNVPYVMFFYNDQTPKYVGYGIHGTYWHNNFGRPMSHGCINMKSEEAALLFEWANPSLNEKNIVYETETNPGTELIIYGQAPNS